MNLLDQAAGRALLVLALLGAAALIWSLVRRRDGVFRADPAAGLSALDLDHPLGEIATLVQFSTSSCATCPQVSRTLGGLAAARPGVVHVEVDAVRRPDLVRRFGVLRTPTVLLLGPDGALRARTSGAVDAARAADALDAEVAVRA